MVEETLEKRIAELEQENAELKEQNRKLLESCEGATMMYEHLTKAKELLKMVLDWQCRCGNGHPTWQEVCAEIEQFLSEV